MEQKDVLKALQRDHAAELKLAAERLKGTARHTEIIPSPVLSEMTGHEILLKPENLAGHPDPSRSAVPITRLLRSPKSRSLTASSPRLPATMPRALPSAGP